MTIKVNKKEDLVSISNITMLDLALISIAVEQCSCLNKATAELSVNFKEMEKEFKKRSGIT